MPFEYRAIYRSEDGESIQPLYSRNNAGALALKAAGWAIEGRAVGRWLPAETLAEDVNHD